MVHRGGMARCLAALALAVLLSGCAATGEQAYEREPHDPLESVNRVTFEFNQFVDRYALLPAAEAYEDHVPRPARTGIGNFLDNLRYPLVALNSFLQGEVTDGLEDVQRFVFNSTFGVFGLIDIATPLGIERRERDFGQTLGHWGVAQGPYLVLPFLGPSTVRDTAGLGVQYVARQPLYPPYWVDANEEWMWGLVGLYAVDTRARLLPATRMMDRVATDPYIFMRESYLQHRAALMRDPEAVDDDDFFADDPAGEPDPFDEEFFGDGE